jgi:hypothetical protein
MKVVKIELLKEGSFWFFQNMQLSPMERKSEPFDWDMLSSEIQENILRSQNQFGLIRIIDLPKDAVPLFEFEDPNGNKHQAVFPPGENKQESTDGYFIEPEPTEEIPSITIENDDPEEELEPELEEVSLLSKVDVITVGPDDDDEAIALLNKNGNTIKKFLSNLGIDSEKIHFVETCIRFESGSKNRLGVITDLNKKLAELKQGDTEWVRA